MLNPYWHNTLEKEKTQDRQRDIKNCRVWIEYYGKMFFAYTNKDDVVAQSAQEIVLDLANELRELLRGNHDRVACRESKTNKVKITWS